MGSQKGDATKKSRLSRALNAESFSGMSNALVGDVVDKYENLFYDLQEDLDKSDLNFLFRTYLSQIIVLTAMTFIGITLVTATVMLIIDINFLLSLVLMIVVPIGLTSVFFVLFYKYPSMNASSRAKNIEKNLPFALNQMSAVAMSGVSPSKMFKLLQNFDEYGELSKESAKIINKVELFGSDVTTALSETAQETPSEEFKEVLYGMVSTIDTGGNLKEFLDQRAESALFDYKLKRKEQIERLSTFASFYTALLIVAPLFLVVILTVMNIVGGELMGYGIEQLLRIGVYGGIPVLNIMFLIVLEVTQGDF